jgi:hypothetical protein
VAPEPLREAARTAGSIAGGGVGGAVRAGAPVRALRGQLPDYVDQRAVLAAGALIRDAQRMNMTLTWPEALSQVTGRDVLTDVQRLLESARQSRSRMGEELGARPQEVGEAGRDQAAALGPRIPEPQVIGPQVGRAAEETLNDARRIINQAAQPYYETAEGIRLLPAEMAQVRAIPGFNDALAQVRNDPQLNRYVAHLPDDSVGVLNEVKKLLDQSAENAASPVTAQRNMQRAAGFGQDARM